MTDVHTLHVTDRAEWRAWLAAHFTEEKEVWLVFPSKASGKPRILYNDAVEEALCFGWIDSQVRSGDHESTMQRFSPRTPKSGYSQANKERLRWLLGQGLVHPSLIETARRVAAEPFVFATDILDAIGRDEKAREGYAGLSEPYKRIRIAYIEAARNRPEEFRKRLDNFIAKTRQGKVIKGHGGIDKYY